MKTGPEITEMIKVANKDFKRPLINMLNDLMEKTKKASE